MSSKNTNWFGTRKEELIRTLISVDVEHPSSSYNSCEKLFREVDIIFSDNFPGKPPIVVVKDEAFDPTMAWLYTYMEEAMPLSIFCGLFTQRDLPLLVKPAEVYVRAPLAWSSIIVGEILARSGTVGSLDDVSMAWVNSSFSMPAALTYCCHPSSNDTQREFLARLASIQDNDQFGRPDFRLEGCADIWEICHLVGSLRRDSRDAVEFCTSLIYAEGQNSYAEEGGQHQLRNLLEHPGFASNSLEERLRAFDEAVIKLERIDLKDADRAFAAAAAAYLVGRGTSHIHLLNGKNNGLSFMWFSLLAAVGGEDAWDPKWFRLVRRIDSHLNFCYPQALKGDSQHDLSWREFDWLMSSRSALESIRSMVKLVPNFVTVEVIPGIPLQVRVSKGSRDHAGAVPKQDSESERNAQLAGMLEEIARNLREGGSNRQVTERAQKQRELYLETEDPLGSRRRKRK